MSLRSLLASTFIYNYLITRIAHLTSKTTLPFTPPADNKSCACAACSNFKTLVIRAFIFPASTNSFPKFSFTGEGAEFIIILYKG